MAENADTTGTKSAIDAASALKEALTKLGASWPGASGNLAPEVPKPDEAESMASRARKKYDSTLRWVLGVFSAVGVLIFGSLPFTDLKGVDFWPYLGFGLIAAGVGLVVVIWAVTTGLELQDAGLGELSQTLGRVSNKDLTRGAIGSWALPRKSQAVVLYKRFNVRPADPGGQGNQTADEVSAHLGPGVTSVDALIERIGLLEKGVLKEQVGWDGSAGTEPGDESMLRSATASTFLTQQTTTELELTSKALTELRGQTDKNAATGQIQQLEARYRELLALLPSIERLNQSARFEALKAASNRYLEHRALVLQESLVAQIRGTYRVVWRRVFLGALLVLVGGTSYAWALSNPAVDTPLNARILVDLEKDTDAWKAVGDCREKDDDSATTDLTGLLATSDDADGLQDGPFTFVTTKESCAGITVTVKQGEGAYQPVSPQDESPLATSTPSTGTSPTTKLPKLVLVGIKANTPAWRKAGACRIRGVQAPIRRLTAMLERNDPVDEARNGPFTVITADARCTRTIRLTIDQGDGRYQRIRPR